MIIVIVGWFVWSMLLLIYQIVVASDFRLTLVLQLYELRNEIMLLKRKCVDPAAERDYLILQQSIEFMIIKIRRIAVSSLIFIELESREVPDLLTEARERARILSESKIAGVCELRQRALVIATKALAVNSIAWAIWLVSPRVRAAARERLSIMMSLSIREFEAATPWDRRRRWNGRIRSA